MANSKIENLSERVDELADGNREDPKLTTEEANMVRGFWIDLHFTPEEAEEYSRGEKRMEYLHELWLACNWSKEYEMESTRLRLTRVGWRSLLIVFHVEPFVSA